MSQQPDENLYLISGSDPAEIENTARKIAVSLVGDNPDPFLCDTIVESDLRSPQEALEQALSSAHSPPFIGGRKTVWLKNFSGLAQEKKSGPWGALFSRLYKFIENRVPADICLLISGPDIDRRKRLYKLCRQAGTIIEHEKPVVGSRGWEDRMTRLIEQRARDKGVEVEHRALQYLVRILGSDTARIDSELEKLITFCGDQQPLSLAAARQICQGDGETTAWAARDAMGQRDLDEALKVSRQILETERDADRAVLGMIRQTADQFHSLIQTLILMQKTKLKDPGRLANWVQKMNDEQRKSLLDDGIEIAGYHPYRLKMLAQQGHKYTGPELVQAMKKLRDAYWQCISAAIPSRIVWEKLMIEIITGDRSPGPGRVLTNRPDRNQPDGS